ncbi:hypothetical protein ACQJBY_004370 [Aegilops geniculata]
MLQGMPSPWPNATGLSTGATTTGGHGLRAHRPGRPWLTSSRFFATTSGIFCCDRQIKDEEQHELYDGCCGRRREAPRAAGGPRRRCAAGALLELGLAGDAPRGPCWSWASPEMRRGGPLLELRGAASRGGSRRRCAVLRAAGDLAGDAPRGPRKKKLGRFFIFLAPDPTAARLPSSGYGWTGRKFRPVRRRLAVPLCLAGTPRQGPKTQLCKSWASNSVRNRDRIIYCNLNKLYLLPLSLVAISFLL